MRATIAFGIVWLHAAQAAAQYRVDAWTTEQGLPQNIVRAVHTGRDGYLWLTTLDGLVRFDGLRFTLFDRANTEGIGSNRFTPLLEAPDGAFWLGTENGGITRYFQGRFTTYTTRDGLTSNAVSGITADEEGRIWALSGERIVEWNGQRFEPAKLADSLPFRRVGVDDRRVLGGRRSQPAALFSGRADLRANCPTKSSVASRTESRRTLPEPYG